MKNFRAAAQKKEIHQSEGCRTAYAIPGRVGGGVGRAQIFLLLLLLLLLLLRPRRFCSVFKVNYCVIFLINLGGATDPRVDFH